MTYYISLLFIVTIICACLKDSRKLKYIIPFIILFGCAALRGEGIGADYYTYRSYFFSYAQMDIEEILIQEEAGYVLLNKILSIFSSDFQIVIVVVSFISLIGIFYFLKENCEKYVALSIWLYMTLYFYIWTFTILRQAIAMSLVMIAFCYAMKDDWIKFVLLVLIAFFFFHNTAIIALIIYPLLKLDLKQIYFILILIISSMFFYFREDILEILKYIVIRRFRFYFSYEIIQGEGNSLLLVYFALTIFIFFLIFNVKSIVVQENIVLQKMILWSSCIGTALQSMSMIFGLFNRLSQYFMVPVFLLLPTLIRIKFKQKDRVIIVGLIMFVSFIFYIYMLNAEGRTVVPYYSIYNKNYV